MMENLNVWINKIETKTSVLNTLLDDRIYDSNRIFNIPYIKNILRERYQFNFNYNFIKNLLNNQDKKIYNFIKDGFETTIKTSKWVYDQNLNTDVEKITYSDVSLGSDAEEKVYKETQNMIFLRVQKKVQTGLIGIVDEKNSKFIEKTEDIKELKHLYENNTEEFCKIISTLQESFYVGMKNLYFLPSSPYMFNAGRNVLHNDIENYFITYYKPLENMTMEDWNKIYEQKDPAFGSCYSMGSIDDDLKSIYDMNFLQAKIFKQAGGFGVNFSKLRSYFADVKTIGSKSSGQVSFMELFNLNTKLIQLHQSTKRGQNMFLLDIQHPEIEKFINKKVDFYNNYKEFEFANITVTINNDFLDKVFSNDKWTLVDPTFDNIKIEKNQRELWENLVFNAQLHGEPGIDNMDIINSDNPLKSINPITSVNPCNEYLGFDRSVCNLGSINSYQQVTKDLTVSRKIIEQSSYILESMILLSNFQNDFPTEELTKNTRKYRNTGVGVMGTQSITTLLGQPYGSPESMKTWDNIMEMFHTSVMDQNMDIGDIIGQYKDFNKQENIYTGKELHKKFSWYIDPTKDEPFIFEGTYYLINQINPKSQVLIKNKSDNINRKIQSARIFAIQPNGSISFLSNVSQGQEPIFSYVYQRTIGKGASNEYTVSAYDESLRDSLIYSYDKSPEEQEEIINELSKGEKLDIINDPRFQSTSKVLVKDKLKILSIVTRYLDMNSSNTFNIRKNINPSDDLLELTKCDDYIIRKQQEKFQELKFDINIKTLFQKNPTTLKSQINYMGNVLQPSQAKEYFQKLLKEVNDSDNSNTIKEVLNTDEYKKLEKIIKMVNDFYLLQQLLKIKGVTVYLEGSRSPVLQQITKQKDIDKNRTELRLGNFELLFNSKTNKLIPKERPAFVHRIMKPLTFKLNGDKTEHRINLEVGFDEENGEPFEVFFRPTESTKDMKIQSSEVFNAIGRLMSWAIRSGADLDIGLEQLSKAKKWNNDYAELFNILSNSINDIIEYWKSKGKKKKDIRTKQEEKKQWIMTSKGYFVDQDGNERCPTCGKEIIHQNGCISCNACGWTQCS